MPENLLINALTHCPSDSQIINPTKPVQAAATAHKPRPTLTTPALVLSDIVRTFGAALVDVVTVQATVVLLAVVKFIVVRKLGIVPRTGS